MFTQFSVFFFSAFAYLNLEVLPASSPPDLPFVAPEALEVGIMGQSGWAWLDTRSVALCRALMAIWILWDLYRRFAWDGFAWFISEPSDSVVPIIDPSMTRHKALVHRVWFYRGSVEFQAMILAVHVLLAVAWGIGWRAGLTGPLLWVAETALHGRNDYICDGSDDTVRHFLFWMALLPGSFSTAPDSRRAGKVDQVALAKKDDDLAERDTKGEKPLGTPSEPVPCPGAHWFSRGSWLASASSNTEVTGPLPFIYILQVVIMYWLMLAMRAKGTAWVYPDFSAVHYAMLCGFRGRTWAKDFVLDFPQLARLATAGGAGLEFLGPLLLLVTSTKHTKLRCLGVAILIFGVQLPLLLMLRLERFQLIAAISALCALPSGIWDVLNSWTTKKPANPQQHGVTGDIRAAPSVQRPPRSKLVNGVQLALSVWIPSLLGLYMLTHAIGDAAGWKEWDNGDIGESTRLTQNWVQFSPNPPDQGYWLAFEGFEFSESDVAPYNPQETVSAWINHSTHYKWNTPAGYVYTLHHDLSAESEGTPNRGHGLYRSSTSTAASTNGQHRPLPPDPLPELSIPSFLFPSKRSIDLMEAERTGLYRKLTTDKAAASRIQLDEDGWLPTYRYPSHYWERYIWAMAHDDDPAQQSYRTYWISKYFCFRWSLTQEEKLLHKQPQSNSSATSPKDLSAGNPPAPKIKVVSIRVLRYQTRPPNDPRITRRTSDDPSWHDPVEEVRMFQTIC